MGTVIDDQEHPLWKKLYSIWVAEKKPGWVLLGGEQWKVLQPGDDKVTFEKRSGFDEYYGSQTRGLPS
jgi:hypothetical protein